MKYSKIETKNERIVLEIANGKKPFTISTQNRLLRLLMQDSISGVSILECRTNDPENRIELVPFAYRVIDYFPNKNVSISFYDSDNQIVIDSKNYGKVELPL